MTVEYNNPRTGLVLSGGGMKASFAVGVMKYIAELKMDVSHIIAGSGSAGTAAYFVSEQYDDMVKIWREKLSTSDFIDLGRVSKVLDIDYLIDIVFKQQVPLDYQKIKQSLMEFEIPVTHLKSGKVHYKSPKDDDLFELLRATKAVPGAYGKAITLSDGQQYIDGSNSSGYELGLCRLTGAGCENIIVIDNGALISDVQMKWYTIFKNDLFKHQYRNDFMQRKEIRENMIGSNIIHIAPEKPLDFGRKGILHNNQQTLSDAIDYGYEMAQKKLSTISL